MNRKKTALRWLLLALTLLLTANCVFDFCYVLPFQALRHTEERRGTGRTDTVYSRVDDRSLITLTANENAVIFDQIYPTLVGWTDSAEVLDCTARVPFHGGWQIVGRDARPQIPYAFGRVDDPDIVEVRFSFRFSLRAEGDPWTVGPTEDYVFSTYRADWLEQEGRAYFILRLGPMGNGYNRGVFENMTLTALNSAGEVVARIGGADE